MHANRLTIRAGSTHSELGGKIHKVTGGFYHGNYEYNYDYDVAVLRVCTNCNIAIKIEDFITGVTSSTTTTMTLPFCAYIPTSILQQTF
jgi:hypothetical protein